MSYSKFQDSIETLLQPTEQIPELQELRKSEIFRCVDCLNKTRKSSREWLKTINPS